MYYKGGVLLHGVRPCEVGAGCVLWLTPRDPASELRCENKKCDRCDVYLEAGAYDHPVVVLRPPSLDIGENFLLVAIVSTG